MPRYRRPRGNAMRARLLKELQASDIVPTYDELAETLGINVNAVRYHVRVLAADGVLTVQPHSSRSIRLTKEPA